MGDHGRMTKAQWRSEYGSMNLADLAQTTAVETWMWPGETMDSSTEIQTVQKFKPSAGGWPDDHIPPIAKDIPKPFDVPAHLSLRGGWHLGQIRTLRTQYQENSTISNRPKEPYCNCWPAFWQQLPILTHKKRSLVRLKPEIQQQMGPYQGKGLWWSRWCTQRIIRLLRSRWNNWTPLVFPSSSAATGSTNGMGGGFSGWRDGWTDAWIVELHNAWMFSCMCIIVYLGLHACVHSLTKTCNWM